MHIRIATVKRKNGIHRYAQLVESYRRPSDGMPATRVLFSLGKLSDAEEQVWRITLRALQTGKAIALVGEHSTDGAQSAPARPSANLSYLDVAVLVQLWKQWKLGETLDELLPPGRSEVPASAVILAAVIQRCLAPTAKIRLPGWFEQSALPELLDVPPKSIHNTRIHRVLDQLAKCTPQLATRLAQTVGERDGRFIRLFADVTDSWFVGCGPTQAQPGQTKEGRFERKINIALLCNEKGYPLSWHTEPGNRHDSGSLLDLIRSVAQKPWAKGVPLVVDRAMGKTAHVKALLDTQTHFITAMTRDEFGSYSCPLPFESLLDFELSSSVDANTPSEQDVARVIELMGRTAMTRENDSLFVLDQGVRTYAQWDDERPQEDEAQPLSSETSGEVTDLPQTALRIAQQLHDDVREGRAGSLRSAGAKRALTRRKVQQYTSLLSLPESFQRRILKGEACGIRLQKLEDLTRVEEPEQQELEFEALMVAKRRRSNQQRTVRTPQGSGKKDFRVRVAAYFNPEMFLQTRMTARAVQEDLDRFVAAQNDLLAHPKSRATEKTALQKAESKLRRLGLVEVYEVILAQATAGKHKRWQMRLELKKDEWLRRRRLDGFCVLVAHPDIALSAKELCETYRGKDKVEKDFHIIKSVVELRPIYHRADHKVEAHVTLCMLALLLERTLHQRLQAAKSALSAEQALAELGQVRLNLYASEGQRPLYRLNQVTEKQDKIVRTLHMQSLIDEVDILNKITAR